MDVAASARAQMSRPVGAASLIPAAGIIAPHLVLSAPAPIGFAGMVPLPRQHVPVGMGGAAANRGGPLRKRNHESALSAAAAAPAKKNKARRSSSNSREDEDKRAKRMEHVSHATRERTVYHVCSSAHPTLCLL